MPLPQTGIFALGNLSHSYLEFDLTAPRDAVSLVTAVADLTEPRTTMGGVNLVAGFRPEIWTQVAASRSPADVAGFTAPVVGPSGYTMPATQYDLTLWIAGSSYDIVFDAAISMGNVVRVKGEGLMINEYESNKLKHRVLGLPTWGGRATT